MAVTTNNSKEVIAISATHYICRHGDPNTFVPNFTFFPRHHHQHNLHYAFLQGFHLKSTRALTHTTAKILNK